MGVARGDAAAPSCYMEGWQLRAYVLLRMDWDGLGYCCSGWLKLSLYEGSRGLSDK